MQGYRGRQAVAASLVGVGLCGGVLAAMTTLALRHGGRLSIDVRISRYAVLRWPSSLRSVSAGVTLLGSLGVTFALATLAAVLLVRRAGWALGLLPLIALNVAALASRYTKRWVARPRPPTWMHHAASSGYSFPSGHSTHAASFLTALGLVVVARLARNRRERFGATLTASVCVVLVGATRVILGVHWFTDVVGGWALGIGTALALFLVVNQFALRSARQSSRPGRPSD